MPAFTKADAAESVESLRADLARCDKDSNGRPIIYTVLRSVSASGMSRMITPLVMIDNKPVSLAWDYDRAHQRRAAEKFGRWCNRVPGAGMDMGFHLADNIARTAGLADAGFRHEWL